MSMPFYVSPEQLMKDRADFARKGIARGRSVVVVGYDGGIAFATVNASRALHKVSEIYDRIAFAAVGKYNEFEQLRVAGIRYADLRGYSYDRTDVRARGLANAYAQTIGAAFTTDSKPLEVEIVVAEVGASPADDALYRLSYDGSVADLRDHVVLGGDAETLGAAVADRWQPGLGLGEVLRLAASVLAHGDDERDAVPAVDLEVAVLERARPRRAFRRIEGEHLVRLLADGSDEGTEQA
ncbi:proteasome subunit alpha [Sanguibacter sp. A247]|uniref:proteasome subunit alpha n=1 Tax=unclassified Sanguibacter TaxID=2645534 RepID=UPI003FD7B0C1